MKTRHLLLAFSVLLLLFAAGCKKKPPVPPVPPAPDQTKSAPVKPEGPAATINSFAADPATIVRGESSTLKWATESTTSVTIDNGIGDVPANGNRAVRPTATTTYRMVAKGLGGDAIANVTVQVVAAPPAPSDRTVTVTFSERITREVQDVFFDYDSSEVREDARATLQRNVDAIKLIIRDFPNEVILIEGHCDERGSAEYNLGLGDRRATSVREFLVQLGVPANKLKTVSFGKEKPFCTESTEQCWQKNRRAHFAAAAR